jgi:hypothetical protein
MVSNLCLKLVVVFGLAFYAQSERYLSQYNTSLL